jgi:hypothetical protein
MLNSKNSMGDPEYVNDVAKIINEYQQTPEHADHQSVIDQTTAKLTEAHKRFLDRNAN